MEDNNLQIKSPIFTPRPGWGGKLKNWLASKLNSRILPTLSVLVLLIGLYGFFGSKKTEAPTITIDSKPDTIEKTVQPRQGLTHLARVALSEYLNSQAIDLSPEQKLFAETYLVAKLNIRLVHAGDTVTFKINDITESINKSLSLTDYQLQEWGKYLKK